MNIFNFCGSGSGGSGGTSVLIQYQKTVDSSHNTQMIVADYPYQVISQVEVLAPNMANPTIDAPRYKTTYHCPPEDSSGNAYIGMDSITILEPYMANPVVDASCNTFTVSTPPHDSSGRVYYGMDSVTVNAPVLKSITLVGNKDSSTVYNMWDEGLPAEGYVAIEQVTIPPVNASVDSNIDPVNIKDGVTILGVTGVYNQDFDYAILYNKLISI